MSVAIKAEDLKGLSSDEKIEYIKLLEARERAKEDQVLERFEPSLVQEAFMMSRAKIRLLTGANRSGKSEVGAADSLMRATGIFPLALAEKEMGEFERIGEYWVSSLDFPSSRDITQKKVKKFLPKRLDGGFNKEYKLQKVTNGSELGFKSSDSGREKYQGTSKLGIWMDEEHAQDVWDEAYMRTTDCGGWLSLTFTPIKGLTWGYNTLYKKAAKMIVTENRYGIPEEVGVVHTVEEVGKLKDRRLRIIENTEEEVDEDIEVFQMSIYDNPYLSDIEIQRAERKNKDDPASYNARILGRFTKLTGRNVFPITPLLKLQGSCPSHYKRGEIEEGGTFRIEPKGHLLIYKDKKPVGQGHYVVGADIAEGLETGDYTCIQVLDHRTCEQVAVWTGHCSPDEAAKHIVNLGTYYNNAIVAPERNFHGFGVVNRIRDHFKYKRLFSEYDISARTLQSNSSHAGRKKYGWDTNNKTKELMINDLCAFIREGHIRVNDPNTVDELITYVYDKHGHTGAMGGCFDDRVMALAIALQVFRRKGIPINTGNSIGGSDTTETAQVSDITGY